MGTPRMLTAAVVVLALTVPGCAPVRSSSDPFAGEGGAERRRTDARPYRVRLEVVCDECVVTYSFAGQTTSVGTLSPIWKYTVDRYPRFAEAIRLHASGQVSAARIYVNGELAASADARVGDDHSFLQVDAVIPPPQEPSEADSLGSEGVRPSPSRP